MKGKIQECMFMGEIASDSQMGLKLEAFTHRSVCIYKCACVYVCMYVCMYE